MTVIFDHVEKTAHNIYSFWFKPVKPIEYIAGQYTQIHLAHDNADDRGDKRWFTLSSSPTDELVSITTKFAKSRPSSFKQTLRGLKPGTALQLADPMGDFVLPKDATIPLLFVAGGIGVTPMHSMVKFLHDRHESRKIHLVHSAQSPNELAWRTLFETSGVRYSPLVQDPAGDWKGETGTLTAERIAGWATEDKRQLIYVSGPELMIEQFVAELPELGIQKDRLVTDYFPGYSSV